ncbi:MAG: AAA family ATPase [Phycisphaeraceae bacterium]|nr:AAA family ATPase [Phycisphaerales bacterium]MCB9861511.1 AAA family ATPase [Phycisphaeraceae bacterium]
MAKRTTKKTTAKKPTKKRSMDAKPNAGDAAAAQALSIDYVPMDRIIGHERAIETIDAAIASGRLHHAWIFSGPSGIGKCTVAHAMAGVVLDPTTAAGLDGRIRPEQESDTQEKLRAGMCPDVHLVRKELARFCSEPSVRSSKQQNIAVDVVREFLLAPAQIRSAHAGSAMASSVYIIDEAELLQAPSQNAMLKLLEEPAPGVVLILVTSREDRLLPTIRSRCQRVAFSSLTDSQMNEWKDRFLNETGTPIAMTERQTLLDFAHGAPGLAKLAIETGLHNWVDTIEPVVKQIVSGITPIGFGNEAWSLIDDWAKSWEKSHAGASKDAANKQAFVYLLQIIGSQLSRMLTRSIDQHDARERCLGAIELLDEAQRQVASNVQIPLAMDTWAAKAAAGTLAAV